MLKSHSAPFPCPSAGLATASYYKATARQSDAVGVRIGLTGRGLKGEMQHSKVGEAWPGGCANWIRLEVQRDREGWLPCLRLAPLGVLAEEEGGLSTAGGLTAINL